VWLCLQPEPAPADGVELLLKEPVIPVGFIVLFGKIPG